MSLYRRILLMTLSLLLPVFGVQFFQLRGLLREEVNHTRAIEDSRIEQIENNFNRILELIDRTASLLFQTPDSIRAVETADNYSLFFWTKQFLGNEISYVLVTDREGTVLVRAQDEYAFGDSLAGHAAVKSALSGRDWRGILELDGVESLIAAHPIRDFAGRIIGSVLMGLELNSDTLSLFKSDTSLEVVLKSVSGEIRSSSTSYTQIQTRKGIKLPEFSRLSGIYSMECWFYEDFYNASIMSLGQKLLIQQVILIVLLPLVLLFIIRHFFRDLDRINRIIGSYNGDPATLREMEEGLLKFSDSHDNNVLLLSTSLLSMLRTIRESLAQLRSRNTDLKRLSRTDALTGLANRMHLDRELKREIQKARRSGNTLSILLFDLDHFKKLNDTFGHLTGDLVLREFSQMIRESIRSTDFAGRWGGEEFLVLLPDTSSEGALVLAEKCRTASESAEWLANRTVTCSIGISLLGQDDTVDSLLARADEALYQAKSRGRNCVVLNSLENEGFLFPV